MISAAFGYNPEMSANSRIRIRFSLLTALLIVAIIALALSVYRLGSEIGPLRVENKKLNEERGTLVFDDAKLVHAIRVPTRFAKNSGTFRVFIPEGSEYVATVAVNDIPKTGLPIVERRTDRSMVLGQAGKNAFAILPPGEHQVSLSVEQYHNGDRYVQFATTAQGFWLDMTVQIPKGAWPQEKPTPFRVYGDGVNGTTESVVLGHTLVLMRHRVQAVSNESLNVSYTMPEPEHPLNGLMLWIEPL